MVSVLGPQHENNLLQVLQVDLFWTLRRAPYGDDAFSDVGQIDSLRFLHLGHMGALQEVKCRVCQSESHGNLEREVRDVTAGQQMFAEHLSEHVPYQWEL